MNEEEKDIELIDRYLKNELIGAEKTRVEQRLANDAGFGKLCDEMKIAIAAVKVSAREKLKSQIGDLERELTEKEFSPGASMTKYWPMGIAAVLIIGFGIFWMTRTPESKISPLFAEAFVPYPNVVMPTVRGTVNDSSKLKEAYAAYDLADYQKSISIFSSLPDKDAGVLLYLGNSYLAIAEPIKARQQFELLQNDFDVFDDQAEWFIALSYLSENNSAECVKRLRKIKEKQNDYAAKASALLSKINVVER